RWDALRWRTVWPRRRRNRNSAPRAGCRRCARPAAAFPNRSTRRGRASRCRARSAAPAAAARGRAPRRAQWTRPRMRAPPQRPRDPRRAHPSWRPAHRPRPPPDRRRRATRRMRLARAARRVQERGIQLRLARGEKIVGYKMGLTSEAKRLQMNLGAPIYGVLTDTMRADETLRVAEGVHPKIEPEIAFVTARELRGKISR